MKIIEVFKNPEKALKWLYKNDKISRSLKRYYAVKRAERGFHRVKYTEMGNYKGYYLLKNL